MRRFEIDSKEFSEINITPFTDVVLVLLIIFMIASPILVTGALKIKLPVAESSETVVKKNIEVFINDKNEIYVNNKIVPVNQLETILKTEYSIKNNSEVIINGDNNITHGSFIHILDIVKRSGATKLLIGTIKK
jgi:biopolymer transport protein TolR